MDTNTGELLKLLKEENSDKVNEFQKQIDSLQNGALVPVDEKDMTKKQKKEQRVSLKDHRSKLGKKLTSLNKPCLCGSGKKYKRCCNLLKSTNNNQ